MHLTKSENREIYIRYTITDKDELYILMILKHRHTLNKGKIVSVCVCVRQIEREREREREREKLTQGERERQDQHLQKPARPQQRPGCEHETWKSKKRTKRN